MKPGLTLKNLLFATGGLLLLTLVQILSDTLTPGHRSMQHGFQVLLLWFLIAVAWILYLVGRLRSRRKNDEKEPW